MKEWLYYIIKNKHDACYDFYGTKIALGSSDGFIEI